MMTLTLTENRSNPQRYVAITRYERRGDTLVKVLRVYDGPNHIRFTKEVPWGVVPERDYWTQIPSGERGEGGKGRHSRPYTVKRDWLQLHNALENQRKGTV